MKHFEITKEVNSDYRAMNFTQYIESIILLAQCVKTNSSSKDDEALKVANQILNEDLKVVMQRLKEIEFNPKFDEVWRKRANLIRTIYEKQNTAPSTAEALNQNLRHLSGLELTSQYRAIKLCLGSIKIWVDSNQRHLKRP